MYHGYSQSDLLQATYNLLFAIHLTIRVVKLKLHHLIGWIGRLYEWSTYILVTKDSTHFMVLGM